MLVNDLEPLRLNTHLFFSILEDAEAELEALDEDRFDPDISEWPNE